MSIKSSNLEFSVKKRNFLCHALFCQRNVRANEAMFMRLYKVHLHLLKSGHFLRVHRRLEANQTAR